jgi:opacity protein-like surface antigen
MKMHKITSKCRLVALALVSLATLATSGTAFAQGKGSAEYYGIQSNSSTGRQGYDRSMSSEFMLIVRNFTAPELTVKNIHIPGWGTNDAVMKIDDSLTYGIGFGYNISPRLNINGDMSYGEADYKANWGKYVINGEGELMTGNINLEFNLLDRAITPFIGGGIGFMYFDSNVPSSTDVYYWWDPWWGYTSAAVVETHSSTNWTWNATAGIRWDVTRGFFVKASYIAMWSKIGASGTELFPQYALNMGWKF